MVEGASETDTAVAQMKSQSVRYGSERIPYVLTRFQYKSITLLLFDNECNDFLQRYKEQFDAYYLPDSCMQVTTWHFFVMRKNSIFNEAVSVIVGLTQAGIVKRSMSQDKPKTGNTDRKSEPISLKILLPTLLV